MRGTMNSSTLLGITTFTYLFTMVLYFYYLFFRNKKLGMCIKIITIIGALIHTAGLGFAGTNHIKWGTDIYL